MSEVLEFKGYPVEVKRRRFQKKLGVSVYPNGAIKVSANKSIRPRQIVKFLMENERWLESSLRESEKLRKQYPDKEFRTGEVYPFLGEDYQLKILPAEQVRLKFVGKEMEFHCPVPEQQWCFERRQGYFKSLKKSYRQVAEKLMSERVVHWKEIMGLQPTGLQFRDQKSIWGSCSAKNRISLNFKLIVAPLEVVDYVIIHELSHIRFKDHSKRFWALVESVTPHRKYSKIWLKDNQFKVDFLAKSSELRRAPSETVSFE